MPIETPLYRVTYKYADDPESNMVHVLGKDEILFHWPGLEFLVINDDFHSLKWVVGLAEISIVKIA